MLKQVEHGSLSRRRSKLGGSVRKSSGRLPVHKSTRSVRIKASKFDVDNFYDSINSDSFLDEQLSDMQRF